MISLKKPLEGVPGLLLMAALVLFGATLGVTAALALSWVEMKDSIANFLGGVVGAGLGAALAVLGSVYVQRKDRRERILPTLNALTVGAAKVSADLRKLQSVLREIAEESSWVKWKAMTAGKYVESIISTLDAMPDGSDLPRDLYERIIRVKTMVASGLQLIEGRYLRWQEPPKASDAAWVAADGTEYMIKLADTLGRRLELAS